jgi:hypothetical protein
MLILEEFESCSNTLKRLLDEMIALHGQEGPPAVTAEWMKRAKALLDSTSMLTVDPRFAELKTTLQAQQYRKELVRLKETVELCQQQLMLQRKAIQTDRFRLKSVKALTGTLRSIQ